MRVASLDGERTGRNRRPTLLRLERRVEGRKFPLAAALPSMWMSWPGRSPRLLRRPTETVPQPPAHVIAVLSQKGGTGKTTLVRSLTYVLRRVGMDVLPVDLDPQGN